MTATLPEPFLRLPLAHRALHDRAAGRPENGRAAIAAAIAAGYGIEIDLQLSGDGAALVFHDYDLDRLTAASGPVTSLTAAEAGALALTGGDGETIPTLPEVLAQVAGRVPLLIELKDQSRQPGATTGALEAATAAALRDYHGPVAVMSFSPACMARMAQMARDIPRGLTTGAFHDPDWPLDAATMAHLRNIADMDRVGASFISHDWRDLARPRVAEMRAAGVPILCWTVRSPQEEADARRIADNVTFEGYRAALPS